MTQDDYDIAQIKRAQRERIAIQSWDYLNQNDPQYAEIVVMGRRMNKTSLKPVSVQDVIHEINKKS